MYSIRFVCIVHFLHISHYWYIFNLNLYFLRTYTGGIYNIKTMPSRDDYSHGRIANFKFNNKHEVSVNQLIYMI